MIPTNGNGHTAERDAVLGRAADAAALKAQRTKNRLLAEQIRGRRLEHLDKRSQARATLEATMAFDWVQPYSDLLSRLRRSEEPWLAGPSAYWNRRYGRNYPIFQSEQELALLRAPARVLCAVNEYAIGLLGGIIDYTVGTGFTYRALPKKGRVEPTGLRGAVQGIIDAHMRRNNWQGGEMPGIEDESVWRSSEDGEFILCHFLDPHSGWTDVRFAEPEQLTQPPGSDAQEYSFGIWTPRNDTQNHQRWWLFWGDTPTEGEEYTRDEIVHYRRNVKRSIKRGLTDFSFDTLDAFSLASHLRTNLGDAGAQQAAIVGIEQYDSGTGDEIKGAWDAAADYKETDPLTGQEWAVQRHRGGEWHKVPKGQNYVPPPTAQNSPIHLQILEALLRSAGRRWRAPQGFMSGDWSNNNFASSLVSNDPFVIATRRSQSSYGKAFERSMWIAVENYCLVHGGIPAEGRLWTIEDIRGLIDIMVEGPNPEVRDKDKEAQRAAVEIPLGVDSPQQYMQRQGRDSSQVEEDNEHWRADHGNPGQPLPLPGDSGPKPPAAPGFESEAAVDAIVDAYMRVLFECHGKGGEPGPCPQGGADKPAMADDASHVRDDKGQAIGFVRIRAALGDREQMKQLLARVTDKDQRSKLLNEWARTKAQTRDITQADLEGLAKDLPPEARSGKAWEAVKTRFAKVTEAVQAKALEIATKAMENAPAIIGTTDDLIRSGFVNSSAGMPATTAAAIATHALAKASIIVRARLSGKVECHRESIMEADYDALADHVLDLMKATYESFEHDDVPPLPDKETVKAALRRRMEAPKE